MKFHRYPSLVLPFTDPCSTLNCQHMCVNTLSGPKCLCSEGFDLDSNGNTCTGNISSIQPG